MKKLITLVAVLIGFMASAQKTTGGNYTYIAQRYEWIAGMFQGLGLPAGAGPADFKTGQERRAGAIYYDSVGIDSGTYVYSGLAWRLLGEGQVTQSALDDTAAAIRGDFPVYTASEGLYKSVNDIQFAAPIATPATITPAQRAINLAKRTTLQFISGGIGAASSGGPLINWSYKPFSPFQFIHYDTVSYNKTITNYDSFPHSVVYASRRLYFENGRSAYGWFGHNFDQYISGRDSFVIRSDGDDYNQVLRASLEIRNTAGFNGKTIIRTHHTNADYPNTATNQNAGVNLSNIFLHNTNPSNRFYVQGGVANYLGGLLIDGSNTFDTLHRWIVYTSYSGIFNTNARILKTYYQMPQTLVGDSIWSWYSSPSTYRFYQVGNTVLGAGPTSSNYKLDVYGASRFSDSLTLTTAREVTDTTGYDIVLRKRTDGTLLRIRADLLGVGGGGSSKFGKSGEDATGAETRLFNTGAFDFTVNQSYGGGAFSQFKLDNANQKARIRSETTADYSYTDYQSTQIYSSSYNVAADREARQTISANSDEIRSFVAQGASPGPAARHDVIVKAGEIRLNSTGDLNYYLEDLPSASAANTLYIDAAGKVTKAAPGAATWSGNVIGTSYSATSTTISSSAVQWTFTGSSPATFTLPARTSSVNQFYMVKNIGSADLTIAAAGTDDLYTTTTVTSITVTPGGSAMVNGAANGTSDLWTVLFTGGGTEVDPVVGAINGIVKANGAGTISLATAGTDYVTPTGTGTLTNKRITARYTSETSSATPTINTDNTDVHEITALAVNITSMTTNLTGTPAIDDVLHIIITGTATRTIAWGDSFESSTQTLPTTTNGTNRLDTYFIRNATTNKWRCTAAH